ncbi:MAG TPA: hypothetical protein VHV78_05430, partial [Gemmatimonadaceae bacterium]|nr:hypothetical protein [Gemmatimonadaceae bacterium]
VALLVGGIETLGLIARQMHVHGAFWNGVVALNENFGMIGYAIIGVFVASWGVSALVYRLKRYDALEIAELAAFPRARSGGVDT